MYRRVLAPMILLAVFIAVGCVFFWQFQGVQKDLKQQVSKSLSMPVISTSVTPKPSSEDSLPRVATTTEAARLGVGEEDFQKLHSLLPSTSTSPWSQIGSVLALQSTSTSEWVVAVDEFDTETHPDGYTAFYIVNTKNNTVKFLEGFDVLSRAGCDSAYAATTTDGFVLSGYRSPCEAVATSQKSFYISRSGAWVKDLFLVQGGYERFGDTVDVDVSGGASFTAKLQQAGTCYRGEEESASVVTTTITGIEIKNSSSSLRVYRLPHAITVECGMGYGGFARDLDFPTVTKSEAFLKAYIPGYDVFFGRNGNVVYEPRTVFEIDWRGFLIMNDQAGSKIMREDIRNDKNLQALLGDVTMYDFDQVSFDGRYVRFMISKYESGYMKPTDMHVVYDAQEDVFRGE